MIDRIGDQPGITMPADIKLTVQLQEPLTGVLMELLSRLSVSTTPDVETTSTWDQDQTVSIPSPVLDEMLCPPPESEAPAATPSSEPEDRPLTFEAAYQKHYLPIQQLEAAPKTLSQFQTAIQRFSEFCAHKIEHRFITPMLVCDNPRWLSEFFTHELVSRSLSTAENMLGSVRRSWNELHELGVMERPAPRVRVERILKQQGISREAGIPIAASISDLDRLLQAILRISDQLTWPRFPTLEPWQFWWNTFAACAFHGFRPGDLWAIQKQHGDGLLWTEFDFGITPPVPGGDSLGVEWDFGWVCIRTNKSGAKLIAPASPHLWFMVRQLRGLDPSRVFPHGQSHGSWYSHIRKIKAASGISGYDVSLADGQPSRSLRKLASVVWKQAAGRAAASHMLCHSVRTGSVADLKDEKLEDSSSVTEMHYHGADIFREVVQAAPAVMDMLPC